MKDAALDKGAQIGRYVVVESVGSGAMGVVYGAYDPELDRKVALKLLKPGHGGKKTARERLIREAKAMARLSHPNVVSIHDVGVFEERVFLAMEFLGGGTIRSWLADKPRGWREILRLFVAAGRGLAAAHAAGILHRDFKPDNVLLDREGRPRVVDFGIAREAGATADNEIDDIGSASDGQLRESSGSRPLLTLTKTGALVGTPAYMAPEQFIGDRGDERSDQFSFCVALYEALYGERPFAGEDILSISVNVTQEQLRPLPRDRGVPAWIRRVIVRGLRADPSGRWPSMAALIATLEDDPAVKRRRRLFAGGTIALGLAGLFVARHVVSRRHVQMEAQIAERLEDGGRHTGAARQAISAGRRLRDQAFAAFDAQDRDRGESTWREARALIPVGDAEYDLAERAIEGAFALDPSRDEIRERLRDLRCEHLLFAEEFRLDSKRAVLLERLIPVDADGTKRAELAAPGSFVLRSAWAGDARLERYDSDPVSGRRVAKAVATMKPGAAPMALAAGSYRLLAGGGLWARVAYPFEVRRGEHVVVTLRIPKASSVPAGFAFVPPGTFWYGDRDEQLRSELLDAVPIHQRTTGAYLIAKHETNYREWIEFLDALPSSERTKSEPHLSSITRGSLELKEADGAWELVFQPTVRRYGARAGSSILYVGRTVNARQDWLLFPVAGVSADDADRYFAWLNETKRVPGARMCTDLEWERAARGGDDRVFPHGDELAPGDANTDLTYGRVDSAYGPDMVGLHPASRSPFEVDDLAGNVLELVTSSDKPGELVMRGGAYFFKAIVSRLTNRNAVPRTFRDVTTGIRVCASIAEVN